ncbi:MAG: serine hydrolase [Gammaproteobacteria bacterium]|nr:serine hydrolase [Gammaproteobacteria bacterium]MDH5800205.1 serine hydrolase [Gammaproteobacteria bacterium]
MLRQGIIITTCIYLLAAVSVGWAGETPFVDSRILKKFLDPNQLKLHSSTVIVKDSREQVTLYSKNSRESLAMASITKLMTAMIVLDSNQALDEYITILREDKDRLRWSRSRLKYGSILTRGELLQLALAASENRAASALARTYPGGKAAFIKAMNRKAQILGMHNTTFADASGLHPDNVASANDLIILLETAYYYPLIRSMSTVDKGEVLNARNNHSIKFINTNRLLRSDSWKIDLSKTGFTSDAGYCLVMFAEIAERPVTIVLLNSWGKYSKYGDANRIRNWILANFKKAKRYYSNVANNI